jgi:hypothetical protein
LIVSGIRATLERILEVPIDTKGAHGAFTSKGFANSIVKNWSDLADQLGGGREPVRPSPVGEQSDRNLRVQVNP